MSSYEHRVNKDGTESHRIRFRYRGRNVPKTFHTEEQALKWQKVLDAVGPAKALALLDEKPASVVGHRTVAEQVAHHIAHLTGITDGTRKRYTGYLDRRISPDRIGRIPLPLLERDDCQAWVNRLAAVPLAEHTIENHHSVLSDALRSAVRASLIPSNPAEGIRIELGGSDEEEDTKVFLTFAEVLSFIAATPEHWRPMVTFMFGTGVRWQEAAALKVRDVDLERCRATIQRAWKDTAGQGHQLGKPKSKRSRRTIVFGTSVAAAIRPLVEGRPPNAFVFTNTRGGPVRHTNFTEQAWAHGRHVIGQDAKVTTKPARGRTKVTWTPGPGKQPTPHSARHTYASLQIARGMPLTHIQRQLGHESITTTNETYGHLVTDDLVALADVIDSPLEIEP